MKHLFKKGKVLFLSYTIIMEVKIMENKVCKRCIMSSSGDPNISFDENGFCNYCNEAIEKMKKSYFPNEEGKKRLSEMIARIKEKSKDSKYDCIMGVSGGLDSSYLLYLGTKWGLRILAIHIDDGFDTNISSSNIKKLIKACGCDYIEIKPDAEQYANINKAYLKAGVPNIAVPQDNILFAELHFQMRKYKIRFFLSGSNFSLESILQSGNTHTAYDLVQIKDIFRKYGTGKIDKLRFMSTSDMQKDQRILHYETLAPLNLVDYRRDSAFKELNEFCGFEYYGRKHLENIFTAFVQLYWLPKKFNVDKRKSHLSSMIISNQLTREEALNELQEPMFEKEMMEEYIKIIKEKLMISDDVFDNIMSSPARSHDDFKKETDTFAYKLKRIIWRVIKKFKKE